MSSVTAEGSVHTPLKYRRYIDGLRGLAIIAVVLYHARLLGVSGGFIGVDVFFVISGFLITSIIVRDLHEGTFSLAGFWERRVRRILPALSVVMFACSIAAYFLILFPSDYHHFGNSLIAQSAFVSNILFLLTDNYFDQPSHYSALLHTWSLSVEEQFYLLFPLLVLAIALFSRRYLPKHSQTHFSRTGERILLYFVIALSFASFLMGVWFVNIRPGAGLHVPFMRDGIFWNVSLASAGFYLLPTRAWELGLGIAAALFSFRTGSRSFAEILSATGFAAILGGIFLFSDNTQFPGMAALIPTLGAIGIIVGNESHNTVTGKILSYAGLVWVGLISYSLYLWHWPLLVFAQIVTQTPLSVELTTPLVVIAVILAWVSYRYIETPVRRKRILRTRKIVFMAAIAAMVSFALLGFCIVRSAYDSNRIPPAAIAIFQGFSDVPDDSCFHPANDDTGLCYVGSKTVSKPQFVVWGDSHASALTPLFDSIARQKEMQGVVFDGGGCAPLTGVSQSPPLPNCAQYNLATLQYIRDHDIKYIFLVSRWNYYGIGGPDHLRMMLLTDSSAISTTPYQSYLVLDRHLSEMTAQLAAEGREVYIVKEVPEQLNFLAREAFYRAAHTGEVARMQGTDAKASADYSQYSNSAIDHAAKTPGVYSVDPSSILCSKDLCAIESDGIFLYRDFTHLSRAGAMFLKPLFAPIFMEMHRHLTK